MHQALREKVSRERVLVEVEKMLAVRSTEPSGRSLRAAVMMHELGLLKEVFLLPTGRISRSHAAPATAPAGARARAGDGVVVQGEELEDTLLAGRFHERAVRALVLLGELCAIVDIKGIVDIDDEQKQKQKQEEEQVEAGEGEGEGERMGVYEEKLLRFATATSFGRDHTCDNPTKKAKKGRIPQMSLVEYILSIQLKMRNKDVDAIARIHRTASAWKPLLEQLLAYEDKEKGSGSGIDSADSAESEDIEDTIEIDAIDTEGIAGGRPRGLVKRYKGLEREAIGMAMRQGIVTGGGGGEDATSNSGLWLQGLYLAATEVLLGLGLGTEFASEVSVPLEALLEASFGQSNSLDSGFRLQNAAEATVGAVGTVGIEADVEAEEDVMEMSEMVPYPGHTYNQDDDGQITAGSSRNPFSAEEGYHTEEDSYDDHHGAARVVQRGALALCADAEDVVCAVKEIKKAIRIMGLAQTYTAPPPLDGRAVKALFQNIPSGPAFGQIMQEQIAFVLREGSGRGRGGRGRDIDEVSAGGDINEKDEDDDDDDKVRSHLLRTFKDYD